MEKVKDLMKFILNINYKLFGYIKALSYLCKKWQLYTDILD